MGKGIFFTSASMLLAVIITATLRHHHHHHHHHPNPTNPPFPNYTSNASKLLRSNGFTFISNFLHISPEHLSLSNPDSPLTVFALPDTAISNLSIPPHMIKHLIAYHTSPTKQTLQDLLNKPLKTCLPTLIPHHTVTITKIDYKKRVLEINNVLITHPNLFLEGHVTMHGVAGSFATFDHHQDNIVLPVCEAGYNNGFVKNKNEWRRMIKFLGSSGFMAFAIGLESMSEGIFKDFKDFKDLNSVTVFVTSSVALRAISSPLLDRFMRVHVVRQRYSFKELEGLPPGAMLSTLVTGKHVVVSENSKVVMIDGVSITVPDLFVSKNLVVHGIARALSIDELSSMS